MHLRLYTAIQTVADSHEPLQIRGKHGAVVVLPLDDWESIQETLYLQGISGYKASLLAASQEDSPWYKRHCLGEMSPR